MCAKKITKYELEQSLEKNPKTDLKEFLQLNQLTQDDFISIVCDKEFKTLHKQFGDVFTLNMANAAKAMGISYPHLVRQKKQGKSIQYSQKNLKGPVYFPMWAIAIYIYLETNPIIPGKITFSNLLSEI